MEKAILLYTSVETIDKFTLAATGLLGGLVSFRVVRDVIAAYGEEENLKAALKKMKNRIFAVIIAITVGSFVAFIKLFYR